MASLSSVPGPRGLPLLGNKVNLAKFYIDWPRSLVKLHQEYGEIVSLAAGDPSWTFVASPALNHELLTNTEVFLADAGPFVKFPKDSAVARMFMNTLPVMNGAHHKQQRRLMQPAFHRKQIAGYHETMVAFTEAMLDTWQTGTQRDMLVEMKLLTQRIAVKTLFGTYDEAEIQRVSHMIRSATNISPLLLLFPFNIPGLPYYQLGQMAEQLEQYIRCKIEEKRTQPDATDVLASLVQAHDEDGTKMTEAEMVSQSITLFMAGHETTSNALAWTLFLLAQHPHVYAALVEEVTGVLQGAPPTLEQFSQMPYLEGVIKESLRLFSPAPIGLRRTATDCELGGYALPEGISVFYSEFVTHRLPSIYEQPLRFLPERWATLRPSPYEYLPFAAGTHMCIGAGFATQELKVVLAMLVQRFRLALIPNYKFGSNLGMQPTHGMPMDIHPQDRQFSKVNVRGNIADYVIV